MPVSVVCGQVIVLVLLMSVGFVLTRAGKMTMEGSRQVTWLLMYIINPCVIVSSLQAKFTPGKARGLLVAAGVAAAVHIFFILASTLIFGKRAPERYRSVLRFASVYSNCGFMGLPLLQSIVGSDGLFYGVAYIAVFNLFCWTHGVLLFNGAPARGGKRRLFLKAVLNPNVFAVFAGVILFLLPFRLPPIFGTALSDVAAVNTPISMIVIGGLIAQESLRDAFKNKLIWPAIALRNLALPLCVLLVLRLCGFEGNFLLALIIPAACPVAGNTALFAEIFGKDTVLPSRIMAISTLLSVVTLPVVLALA